MLKTFIGLVSLVLSKFRRTCEEPETAQPIQAGTPPDSILRGEVRHDSVLSVRKDGYWWKLYGPGGFMIMQNPNKSYVEEKRSNIESIIRRCGGDPGGPRYGEK